MPGRETRQAKSLFLSKLQSDIDGGWERENKQSINEEGNF